jgi:hypothetical protein
MSIKMSGEEKLGKLKEEIRLKQADFWVITVLRGRDMYVDLIQIPNSYTREEKDKFVDDFYRNVDYMSYCFCSAWYNILQDDLIEFQVTSGWVEPAKINLPHGY